MTQPFNSQKLQFYMTIPSPCPYLPERMERKIFAQLDPITGPYLNNYLTHSGFRRSQNVLYRPACENCQACRSLRVKAPEFTPTRSMKRIVNRNKDLAAIVCPSLATDEQFDLLARYLNSRHAGGGMSDMDYGRYEMMVEECATESQILEYRNAEGRLIACVLVDVLMDGYSMVYSFFDPDENDRSLGHYMILDHIKRCQDSEMLWLYLGYWVKESPKMDYKARYKPCQILGVYGWQNLGKDDEA
ncbi:MAG: arginyltransferase [Hellea sp.]|nr:arginyltransferase [Hellea sp.]